MAQNIKYADYSSYLNTLGGLLNWASYTSLAATQQTAIQQYFDNNAQDAWIHNNWLNVCPNGEARFVGNQGFYPNDLSKTAYWTPTAMTITANQLANPADGRVTASKLLETVANSQHGPAQTVSLIPNATYQFSCFARPIGGRWLLITFSQNGLDSNAFFDLINGVAYIDSGSDTVPTGATIQQCANGFWFCYMTYVAPSDSASTGSIQFYSSPGNGVYSFVGNTSSGLYLWGCTITQTTYASPTSLLIPYDQLGEDFIDAVFQVWQQSPVGAGYPASQGFQLMPDGVQIIGTNAWVWNGWLWTFPTWYTAGWPLYLYYRKGCPSFTGTNYSAMATYAVDDQILFTSADTTINFWKCVVATTAGQSPDTTASSWQILQLPQFLFLAVTYKSAADYYRMSAQFEKAAQLDSQAQGYLDTQSDKMERQQGIQPPFRVGTHLNSQGVAWPTR